MNWRAGLFRVWLVLSATWLIFGVWISWVDFDVRLEKRAYYFTKGDEFYHQSPSVLEFGSAEYKSALKTARKGRYEIIDVPPNAELFVSADLSDREKKKQSSTIHNINKHIYNNKWWDEIQETVVAYVQGFLVPPLILFAFGSSLLWALRGFRS